MISKNAKHIQNSLVHIKKISGVALKVIKVFLTVYLLLTIPFFCYSVVSIVASGLAPLDLLWAGLQILPMVLSVVVAISVCIALLYVFKDINAGSSPFTISQSRRLKLIGWLLLVSFILGAVVSVMPLPYTQIGSLTFGPYVSPHGPSGVDINLSYVLWAVVCFSFSYVFRYGALLQQLSDDTV